MDIVPIYIVYVGLAIFVFWWLPLRTASLLVFFGGWLVLPVGNYPQSNDIVTFPYWITGLAIPSQLLINKAWIVPMTTFVLSSLFCISAIRCWRPTVIDIPIFLWCVWPLVVGVAIPASSPEPAVSSLYLFSSWGLTWLIGRIWFSSTSGRIDLIMGVAVAGIACLPIAVVEGYNNPDLYEFFYEPHPYRFDGIERYFGFRPIGFFEHGSQYGIWVVISAIASIWLAVVMKKEDHDQKYKIIAVITLVIALASQSIGAIILGILGLVFLVAWGRSFVMPAIRIAAALLATAFILHISGILPLEYIARQTEVGQMILNFMRDLGRGSFFWRFSQDIKSLELLHSSPIFGLGTWNWWEPVNTRPWGLAILIMGQFGIIGSALAFLSLANTAIINLMHQKISPAWSINGVSVVMALIVLVAMSDALLNSFLYFPVLIIAGALNKSKRR